MATAVAFRTNCRRRATVSATDEFWFSPASHELPTSPADDDCGEPSDSDGQGSDENSSLESDSDMIVLPLPPAHDQLLSDESASYQPLGGYDHTCARSVSHENVYGDYGFQADDDVDGEAALDAPVGRVRRRLSLSAVRREGRGSGSWLLDFARLGGGGGDKVEETEPAPGLVREESDEESSASEGEIDDDASSASASSSDEQSKRKRPGVSFSPSVAVRPVPHSDCLGPAQRRRMYAGTLEVRRNKIRNKREYRYDGCDWRNATEEWEMGVDMVTGELVHPAHEAHLWRGQA
ncbi:hypothetical protein ACHAWF_001881 [Thalassiosira exigua]